MFSQTTEYALRAMAWLAALEGDPVSTGVLAEKAQVPQNYLAKVLQQMASAGLVSGQRGVRGGYKLAKPAESITLLDVARSVAPLERIDRCPLASAARNGTLCPLHRVADRAAAAVIEVYGSVTLRDLLKDATHPLCHGDGHAHSRKHR